MRIGDVMTRDVEFVPPGVSVAEVAETMGDLPVGSADDLQGILTDRDILFRVVARGVDSGAVTAGEVMTTTVFSCRQEDSLTTALDLMGARNIRRLPVLDGDGRVIGLVTLSDLSRVMLLSSGVIERAVQEIEELPA